jgi:hypothetical protein
VGDPSITIGTNRSPQRKRSMSIDLREQIGQSIRNAFARARGRV